MPAVAEFRLAGDDEAVGEMGAMSKKEEPNPVPEEESRKGEEGGKGPMRLIRHVWESMQGERLSGRWELLMEVSMGRMLPCVLMPVMGRVGSNGLWFVLYDMFRKFATGVLIGGVPDDIIRNVGFIFTLFIEIIALLAFGVMLDRFESNVRAASAVFKMLLAFVFILTAARITTGEIGSAIGIALCFVWFCFLLLVFVLECIVCVRKLRENVSVKGGLRIFEKVAPVKVSVGPTAFDGSDDSDEDSVSVR